MADLWRDNHKALLRLDPLDRAKRISGLIADSQRATVQLAILRSQAIAELREAGWSLEEIGDELGVSRQQVHRLLKARA